MVRRQGGANYSTLWVCKDKVSIHSLFPGQDDELQGHCNGQVVGVRYRFTGHLLALDSCKTEWQGEELDTQWNQIITPLNIGEWQAAMSDYPDAEFRQYVLSGIKEEF